MEDIPRGNPMHEHDPTAPPPPPAPPAYNPGYPPQPPAAPGYGGGGNSPTKPGKVQAMSIMMLISGILNCILGLSLVLTCYGIILAPLPITCGILEIIHATKLLKDPIETYKPPTGLAILEICCILACGMTACVIGILNLVFSGDPEVKQYYRDVALARGYQPQV